VVFKDNPCSKHTQPLEQTALPLQVQIRSCQKSDDLESRQEGVLRLLQTLQCAYSVENRLLKKTENSKIKTAKRIQNVKDTAEGQNKLQFRLLVYVL
jgi:hypothetical protein